MQISIRELKANPGRAIASMRQGERVQITSHGKVVAEPVPPDVAEAVKAPMSDDEGIQHECLPVMNNCIALGRTTT